MNESHEPGHSEGPRWRRWLVLGVLVLLLIFVAMNFQEVTVDFLFAETKLPLFFALIVAGLLGVVAGLLAPRVRRHSD